MSAYTCAVRMLATLALGLSFALSSCGSTAHPQTYDGASVGEDVVLSRQEPRGECDEIGPIIGSSGGAAFGAWVPNDELARSALDDLRDAAARSGATHVQHGDIQFGETDGTTTSAMVVGTAYTCGSASETRGSEITVGAPLNTTDYVSRGADGTFEEAVRLAVAAQGQALLRCLGTANVPLTLVFGAGASVESFRGPVRTVDAEECVQNLLHRVRITHGGQPRSITVVIAADGSVYLPVSELSVHPSAAEPTSAGASVSEADLREALDRNASAILACTSSEVAAIRVERTSDGVLVDLQGDLAGTPEAACVRSVVGELVLPGGQDAVIHVVRRP